MNEIELWLVGIALAMDCLTVSLATGMARKRVEWRPMTMMALAFGLFQGGMFALGDVCTNTFVASIETIDHWVAFSLLAYLGGNMIWNDLRGDEEASTHSVLTLTSILTMAVATSIDALAVGVSFACIDSTMQRVAFLHATLVIALCSTMLSVAGLAVGILASKSLNWHMESVGGVVLILIGLKILCSHLM